MEQALQASSARTGTPPESGLQRKPYSWSIQVSECECVEIVLERLDRSTNDPE